MMYIRVARYKHSNRIERLWEYLAEALIDGLCRDRAHNRLQDKAHSFPTENFPSTSPSLRVRVGGPAHSRVCQ
jgi:hypothetical protein